MITQYLIRSGNLRQIYQLIDQNIGISRARLAKITKLSKTTVSSLVDELIAGGYVLDCGAGASQQQGRRPNVLRVNGAGNVVAVISWRRAAGYCAGGRRQQSAAAQPGAAGRAG